MRLPRLLDGLVFRIGLLLTVALVPIGLISIWQTNQLVSDEKRRSESAIMALTAEAAASEESFMRAGVTVAQALAAAVPLLLVRPDQCSAIFRNFIKENGEYSFAGYIDKSGHIACASDALGRDVSQTETFQRQRTEPSPRIDVVFGQISKTSVIVMSQPLYGDAGEFAGYVSVSLPNRRAFRNFEQVSPDRPVDLVTFNDQGRVLSAETGLDSVSGRLPRDHPLSDFVGKPRTSFTGVTMSGEKRAFAVVPVISDLVYALGSWPVARIEPGRGMLSASPFLFPGLMWLASLAVAYLAVHRLAIRNITRLRQRMADFTGARRLTRAAPGLTVPLEFREIEQTWADVAETVIRDEAELENTIHARTVLLKEVHHRVKNNLQLIASIVSMKLRKAATPEARTALREVQMRVMSIATVHRALYTTSSVGKVQANELLSEIVARTIEAGAQTAGAIRITSAFDAKSLYPDQAVPLSLLASEAVTNALKYVGRPEGGETPWLTVRLERLASDEARLTVENSVGEPLMPVELARGTGLGANLIQAFARQMRGVLEPPADTPGLYRVRLHFPIVGFDQTPQDSTLPEAG